MSNCIPCSPCNNNCPDNGEIIETTILDADDCGGCGSCGGCKDNCGINIQSTNDCLTVDTSECGVIKLTAECPKPTYVKAGTNVTVRDVTPPSDCYIDGGECGTEGGWEVSSTDEKVKACEGDTTPGYLNEKLDAGTGIIIDEVGCGGSNSYLRISVDEDILPDIPSVPDLVIHNYSEALDIGQSGDHKHIVTIRDNTNTFYDNTICLGIKENRFCYNQPMNSSGNMANPVFIDSSMPSDVKGWNIYTGNPALATKDGIKIKQKGFYRVFGQLTVQNNLGDSKFINLGRGLLRILGNTAIRPELDDYYLSTAKHGEYTKSFLLRGGKGIKVDNNGEISVTGTDVKSIGSGGGSIQFRPQDFNDGISQPAEGDGGPWMTFNMDCYVDLYPGDVITLGYRGQSDMPDAESEGAITSFMFSGKNDYSTEFQALFGGTILGVQMVAPILFNDNTSNKVRGEF